MPAKENWGDAVLATKGLPKDKVLIYKSEWENA